ncbi:MAG: beta strand repeat-containing protein [Bryobacteraceae bacterium]
MARSAGYSALLSDSGITLQSDGAVRIAFKGGKAQSITAAELLVTRSNYFIGNDPERWQTNVPNFGRVRYSALYPGIDAAIYGDGRNLEYDFIVAAGADPTRIRLMIEGRDKVALDAEGNLQLPGGLIMRRPLVYQQTAQGRRTVAARYQLNRNEVRFQIGEYDPELALVIDPVLSLSYSTLLGGNGDETAWGVAVDSNGNAYIAGVTSSTNFPTVNAYQGSFHGGTSFAPTDFFVAKFNPAGTALLYSTYLGGSGNETVSAGVTGTGSASMLAIDLAGNAYITGLTASITDYPVTAANAYQPTLPQGQNGSSVLSKLSPSGGLLYSTYFGGIFAQSNAVAVDNNGNAYLAGSVSASGFGFPGTPNALTGAFTPTDFYEAFLAKINTNLAGANSLQYATFFGRNTFGTAVAVDNTGGVYLAGNLPVIGGSGEGFIQTKNPLYAVPGGGGDAFLAKFDPTQSGTASLIYATYFGGSGADVLTGVATDSNGNVYIGGSTSSNNLPTTLGAYQQFPPLPQGPELDLFVAKLNSTGTAASYVTYVGGSGADTMTAFAVDPSGNAVLTGSTSSSNFPQVNGLPFPASQPSTFTFVTKLNAAGSNLVYSSYFTDSGSTEAAATDLNGNVYLAGQAFQGGLDPFPVTLGAYQTQFAASTSLLSDAFLSKLVFTGTGPSAPAVTGVTPNLGGQGDKILVTFNGANFLPGATPSLTMGGTTITGTSVQIAPGGGSLTAVFDLRFNPLGTYDASVTNPDTTSGILTLAFSLQSSVITIVPAQAGSSGAVTVTVRGGIFEQNALVQLVQNTTVLTAGIPTTVRPDGLSVTGTFQFSNPPSGAYAILINNPDGTFQTAPAAFTIAAPLPASVTMTPVGTAIFGIGKYQTFAANLCNSGNVDSSPRRLYVEFPSYEVIVPQGYPYNTIVNNGYTVTYFGVGVIPASQCVTVVFVVFTPTTVVPHQSFRYFFHMSMLSDPVLTPNPNFCNAPGGGLDSACVLDPGPPPKDDNDPPGGDDDNGTTDPRTPNDPNLKTGPAGGGAADYITPQTALSYFVEYENTANASAPAQDVTVTDQIDPSLVDVTTLSFGNMGWGNQVITLPGGSSDFTTTVDLRPGQSLLVQLTAHFDPATNTITWKFHSIDPATGQSPNDPTVGFLPPNTSPPAGQGYVYFSAQQKPGLTTGTAISNTAGVIFNALAPIVTPAWVNTIDANPPVSAVAALPPAENSACFTVSWSGTDVGSGILNYTIFVSDNGGAFAVWLVDTTLTSSTYTGTAGHSYAFYSVAQDAAGNFETKSIADTSTNVGASAPSCAVTINTSPAGLQLSVDNGALQTAPQVLNLSPGTHTITVSATQSTGAGTQDVFQHWQDNSTNATLTITVGTSAATYTATFQTQYQLTTAASPTNGGTVSPATGTYYNSSAVVNLNATPNTGFSFGSWTGNVASNSSAATTITMGQPQTVVANFTSSSAQPVDVSSQVKVTGTGLVFSRATNTYSGTVTIANISSTPIAAPIQSVFTNLISGATLTNATGKVPSGPYAGAPYITVAGSSPLAPGASVSISVKFTYTGTAPISYVSKTLSGGF